MYRNIAENKEYVIRIILIVLNIAVATAIFMFSAQPADVSGPMSCGVVYKFLEVLLTNTSYNKEEIMLMAEALNGIVRKLAHFSIYAVFGMLMYLLLSRYKLKNKTTLVLSVLICFLYAVSDEIHQYFVPGRSCELRDVLIDTAGIVSGIIIICLLKTVKRKLKKV